MKRIFFVMGICLLTALNVLAADGVSAATAAAEKTYVKHINTDGFLKNIWNYRKNKDFIYEGKLPCIVDFYATWCGPCRKIAPYMEELAKEYAGKIDIYKVNIDESRELAQVFSVTSIPTLLYIPGNAAPQMSQGAMSKEQYKYLIDHILLQKPLPKQQ